MAAVPGSNDGGSAVVHANRNMQQHGMVQVNIDRGPGRRSEARCRLLTLIAQRSSQNVLQFLYLTGDLVHGGNDFMLHGASPSLHSVS